MTDEITQASFDGISFQQEECYAGLPPEIIASLEHRALRIQGIVHNAVLEVGRELAEAKQEIAPYRDGGFENWVEKKTNITRAYAYQLIDTHDKFGMYTNSIHAQFSGTSMRMLSFPGVPQSARDEAIQRAESGEEITVKLAKEIAVAHKAREEAEKKADKAQEQVTLFTQLVQEKQEKVDELSQQIKDLEKQLENAVKPDPIEVIPQATKDQIAQLKELNKKQKERNNMLSDHIEKLRTELQNQRDANEARRKQEAYVAEIKQDWKKATDTLFKALSEFHGKIPSPIATQVFEGEEWARYDKIDQALAQFQSAFLAIRTTRYSDQFIDANTDSLAVYGG